MRLLALLSLALLLAGPVTARADAPPPDSATVHALRLAESQLLAARFERCIAVADSLARANRDRPAVRSRALTLIAAAQALGGRADLSEPAAREAMALARAGRDSSVERHALRWLAYSQLARGRLRESTPLYRRLLALSTPAADWSNAGYGEMGIAYDALMAGRLVEARQGYERSVADMRRGGDAHGIGQATIGLARVLDSLGDFDAERGVYRELLADAARNGDWQTEAYVENNLGAIENTVGDPALALAHWRRALAVRSGASLQATAATRNNIALSLSMLGRYDEAAATLDSVIAACRASDLLFDEVQCLERLGTVRRSQGRFEESWAALSRALALADSVPSYARQWLVQEAALTLSFLGRHREAWDLLARERAQPGLAAEARGNIALVMAGEALLLGRAAESVTLAREALAIAERTRDAQMRLDALSAAADGWRALGRADSAQALYERAAAGWEAVRRVPADPEWREHRGAAGVRIYGALAALALARGHDRPSAARAAFDLLQRYKARTLLERMAGPGRDLYGVWTPVDAGRVMQALRPGEVLLDFFDGQDSTLVFAVDRAGVSVTRLAPAWQLAERARLLHDLLADPRGGAARERLDQRAAAALGRALFGGVAARVRGAEAVILAPDGALNQVPLESLPLPGDGVALAEAHDTWRVPSATVLVELRRRGVTTRGRGVLAIAGTRDPAGRSLPGAVGEVRALGRRFAGVDVRVLGEGGAAALALTALPTCDVLHVAAHIALDDQRPWNSGVFLTGAAGGEWLRASAIATTPLAARLAVLAGCASVGGRALSGEGVQGLAAAFLSAGVPTVVATLWPVDDRVATRFSAAFYRGLARGQSAAGALRGAQREMRAHPGSARAFDWAGFVLIGDGTTRVRLTERPTGGWLAAGLVLAAALVAGIGALGARRRAGSGGL